MDHKTAEKYLELARYQAQLFSKDPNTKVAAIVLSPESLQIVSTGYNGIPRKMKETKERWERPTKYTYVVHAEANAICNAARQGVRIENGILVVTMFPCIECTKMLIQSGIKHVICPAPDYTNERWKDHFLISEAMMDEMKIERIMI